MDQQEFGYASKIIKEETGSNYRDGLVSAACIDYTDLGLHCRHWIHHWIQCEWKVPYTTWNLVSHNVVKHGICYESLRTIIFKV